jgi:hypothetical protein
MKRILLAVMCALLALAGACQSAELPAAATPAATAQVSAKPAPSPAPTPTPAPVPTTTPEPAPTRITVMAVGDLMCLHGQLSAAHVGGGYSFDYVFAAVKDILSSADLTVGNLETLIADGHPYTGSGGGDDDGDEPAASESAGEPGSEPSAEPGTQSGTVVGFGAGGAMADIALQHGTCQQRQPLFTGPLINGPESFLSAVAGAGFDVLINANNHINDYGVDGIQKTLAMLDSYGMYHTGAYAAEGSKAPLVVDVQGIKIGFVAYTDHLNRGSGGNKALIDLWDEDMAAADIAAAREAGADFIIAYVHWGKENTHSVVSWQRKPRGSLPARRGSDFRLAPACLQEFELIETDRGTVPVLYSLGNFVSSMGRAINDDGIHLKIELVKDNVTGENALETMSYIPTYP